MACVPADGQSLRIVHVLRAPLGGLFRHVLDLTREQIARGHKVGLITDSLTGGQRADEVLDDLSHSLELGLMRMPMKRNPSFGDIRNLLAISARCRTLQPDIVHGHGSKGGLYARLPGLLSRGCAIRAYTPHGGSFNYKPGSPIHRLYMMAEGVLERATDIFLFESAFIQGCFKRYVGETSALNKVVLNGIGDDEFEPVQTIPDAADFFYIGELRSAKGIDTLIDAMALVRNRTGRRQKLLLIGSGPDKEALTAQARQHNLQDDISFPGVMPARTAFTRGKILVVPSRAESLPYVVLEAAGASVPMIATNVGGIPEIFGPHAHRLIDCDDAEKLAQAMLDVQSQEPAVRAQEAAKVRDFVQSRFHVDGMADAVLNGYREALLGTGRLRARMPEPVPVV